MSTNATLIGSNRVTESEVYKVPAVPFTQTFHPIHHKEVIEALRSGIQAVGLQIVKTEYVLANQGKRMFGVWDLDGGSEKLCWSVGLRNSLDKSMAMGIVAGLRVFVCENLCFSGDGFIELRRHTKGLVYDELEYLAYKAMKKMIGQLVKFQSWHEGLKNFTLTETAAKLLLVEIMEKNVIPPSKFMRFSDLYFGGAYGNTLYGFLESTTDLLRDSNLLTLPAKNKVLNSVVAAYIDSLYSEGPSSLAEFYSQRARYHRPRLIS